jgi:hypothetical protein
MSVIGAITGFAAYTALHRPGAGTPEEDFSWTGAAVWAASGAAMGATVGYLGGYALAYWGPPVWITLNGATYVLGQELVNRWPNANVLLGHFLKHGQQVASILRTTNYTIDRYGADAVYILENPLYRKPIENGWAYIRYLGTSPSGTAYFGLVIEKLGRIVTFYPISVRDAAHGLFREFVLR